MVSVKWNPNICVSDIRLIGDKVHWVTGINTCLLPPHCLKYLSWGENDGSLRVRVKIATPHHPRVIIYSKN